MSSTVSIELDLEEARIAGLLLVAASDSLRAPDLVGRLTAAQRGNRTHRGQQALNVGRILLSAHRKVARSEGLHRG